MNHSAYDTRFIPDQSTDHSHWELRRGTRMHVDPRCSWSYAVRGLVAVLLAAAVLVSWFVLSQNSSAAMAAPMAQVAPLTQGEQVY